ncbi:MAG: long-chain-acyl-CoA synthetase [Robiginitomaculum sp.]|nr:MAG: long-chain-acyl-CoA synthetase [Robiginitomaculum sp.]
MGFLSNLRNDFGYVRTIKGILKLVKDVDSESTNLVPDDIERSVDIFANNLAFMAEGQEWTYREFDNYANQVAHWALAHGCTKGDTVAVFVRNRLEYVALWFGLAKIGVIPALINYQLRAKALAHCINISSAKLAIIDCELSKDWNSAAEFLEGDVKAFGAFGTCKGLADFDNDVSGQSTDRPARSHREGIKGKDTFMKMFTSGTTGLPKAAKVAHTRGQYYLRGFCVPAKATFKDRIMMVLPLYHATGGLCGVGIALTKGGAVIVSRKFSVSGFWDEVAQTEATIFMYVGELCRFLLNAGAHPKERTHKLRCIVGNGLSKDVWEEFITRFNIADVVEFYGATEGNISLMNFDGPPGAVGRIPEFLRAKMNGDLIRYDVETGTHIKGPDGLYMRTEVGEIGELVGEIRKGETRFRYDGYEDKEASDKKILHNVLKKDDMWFRTGDLLWRDERGYYFFADRIGDTYRWKAENVSTGEVAAAMSAFDGVHQANVYGVEIPGYDGRAGMASLVADKDLDLKKLHAHICDALPAYAQPVFLRISDETETTSTFKFKKTNLVKDGFDPARVKDMLFVNHPEKKSYEKLGKVLYKKIQNCELKF